MGTALNTAHMVIGNEKWTDEGNRDEPSRVCLKECSYHREQSVLLSSREKKVILISFSFAFSGKEPCVTLLAALKLP